MRHVLLPCAIAMGTLGVGEATSAAHLIAPASLTLRTAPGQLRTLTGAVDLTAVARAAHQHLDCAARAHKGSGTGLHPHSRSSRRAQWLDETGNQCNTAPALVPSTVGYDVGAKLGR